jgi:hypothetical protein
MLSSGTYQFHRPPFKLRSLPASGMLSRSQILLGGASNREAQMFLFCSYFHHYVCTTGEISESQNTGDIYACTDFKMLKVKNPSFFSAQWASCYVGRDVRF